MQFCTFLCHHYTKCYDMKLLNFMSLLHGVGEHNTKNCRFLFLNLDNHRYSCKENFAKICQIKWNWIRLVKFEIVQIDFEVTLWVCCRPKILLPWQRDITTSPLYSPPNNCIYPTTWYLCNSPVYTANWHLGGYLNWNANSLKTGEFGNLKANEHNGFWEFHGFRIAHCVLSSISKTKGF